MQDLTATCNVPSLAKPIIWTDSMSTSSSSKNLHKGHASFYTVVPELLQHHGGDRFAELTAEGSQDFVKGLRTSRATVHGLAARSNCSGNHLLKRRDFRTRFTNISDYMPFQDIFPSTNPLHVIDVLSRVSYFIRRLLNCSCKLNQPHHIKVRL